MPYKKDNQQDWKATSGKMRSIYLVGNFGKFAQSVNGQSIRTAQIHQLLEAKMGLIISFFDTSILKIRPWLVFSLLRNCAKHGATIYLGGKANLLFIFPFIFFVNKLFSRRLYNVHIGGWMADFLKNKTWLIWKLKRVNHQYSESPSLKITLIEKYGFTNLSLLHNFRIRKEAAIINRIEKANSEPFNFVFLSRIAADKGVFQIFEMCKLLSVQRPDIQINIDFYGPITASEVEFNNALAKETKMKYCGVLKSEEVYMHLERYDAMLFPTYYHGEGHSGAVIEAFMAGIPVIASDWKYNPELIRHLKTGLIFKTKDVDDFTEKVILFCTNPELRKILNQHTAMASKKYHHDAAWEVLRKTMDLEF